MAVNEIPVKSYLNLERDPVSANHAVTKNYVDTEVQNLVETKAAAEHTHLAANITDLGTAAKKGFTTSVTSGSADLVTSGGVYSYIAGLNLGTTYAAKSHNHAAGDINSGTLAAARLPDATTSAKGGVIVGAGLSVSSGTISVDYSTVKTGLGLGTAAYKSTGTGSGNVPVLDSNGKLSESVIPTLAITDTFEADSQAAMLALSSAKKGDVCIRSDLNKSFILAADGYSTLANWKELKTPTDAVLSVNGQTGAITLAQLGLVTSSSNYLRAPAAASDTSFPSEKAVAAYVKGLFDTLGTASTYGVEDVYENSPDLATGGGVYAFVTGAIADLDLANTYAAKTHNHAASAINSGTLDAARLPAATTSVKGAVILSTSSTYSATDDTKAITGKAAKAIADASAAAATPKAKIFTITGDGTATDFTCTHGLGVSNVLVQVYDSSGNQIWVAVAKTSTAVTFKFAAAPASGTTYTAVIFGVTAAS